MPPRRSGPASAGSIDDALDPRIFNENTVIQTPAMNAGAHRLAKRSGLGLH
jgi:hypothetical protein